MDKLSVETMDGLLRSLLEDKDALKKDNDALKEDKDALKKEINRLMIENAKLMMENARMFEEIASFKNPVNKVDSECNCDFIVDNVDWRCGLGIMKEVEIQVTDGLLEQAREECERIVSRVVETAEEATTYKDSLMKNFQDSGSMSPVSNGSGLRTPPRNEECLNKVASDNTFVIEINSNPNGRWFHDRIYELQGQGKPQDKIKGFIRSMYVDFMENDIFFDGVEHPRIIMEDMNVNYNTEKKSYYVIFKLVLSKEVDQHLELKRRLEAENGQYKCCYENQFLLFKLNRPKRSNP